MGTGGVGGISDQNRPPARPGWQPRHVERCGDADVVRGFQNLRDRVVGRVTAGRLAEVTGLTTGAITGVVDRLEKAGFVRRERDDNDRRKVFIAVVPENTAKIGRLYQNMQRAILKDWESYSDAELKLLLRFANQGYKTMLSATEELKAMMAAPKAMRKGATKPARSP